MTMGVSRNSTIANQDIAVLLGSAMDKYTDKGLFGVFGKRWAIENITGSDILSSTLKARNMSGRVGHATNGWKAIKWLRNNDKYVDRIMVFTDEQLWDSTSRYGSSEHTIRKEFNKYKQEINPDAKVYVFDLAGYGSVSFPQNDNSSVMISGWNSNIFDFIEINEQGYDSQLNYIKNHY